MSQDALFAQTTACHPTPNKFSAVSAVAIHSFILKICPPDELALNLAYWYAPPLRTSHSTRSIHILIQHFLHAGNARPLFKSQAVQELLVYNRTCPKLSLHLLSMDSSYYSQITGMIRQAGMPPHSKNFDIDRPPPSVPKIIAVLESLHQDYNNIHRAGTWFLVLRHHGATLGHWVSFLVKDVVLAHA